MRHYAMIFGLILILSLSVAVPAEDVPETAFDESETPPYESTPLFSIVVRPVAARATEDGVACVSPVRFTFLNACGEYGHRYEARPMHPHPDSSAIFGSSLRC